MSSEKSVELERTFLAKRWIKQLDDTNGVEMVDCYFPGSQVECHPRLRARKYGSTFTLTKKLPLVGGDASRHTEHSIALTQTEFECLSKASDRIIRKLRYRIDLDGIQAEVDVFSDTLRGLVLIDFEFDSELQMNQFAPPDVCLSDVTQEHFIAGGLLAGKSYGDIQSLLEEFGYDRILG